MACYATLSAFVMQMTCQFHREQPLASAAFLVMQISTARPLAPGNSFRASRLAASDSPAGRSVKSHVEAAQAERCKNWYALAAYPAFSDSVYRDLDGILVNRTDVTRYRVLCFTLAFKCRAESPLCEAPLRSVPCKTSRIAYCESKSR